MTGGMGFIGQHVARRFLDVGEGVVVTRYRAGRRPSLLDVGDARVAPTGARLRTEPLDLTDGWSLLDVLRRHRVRSVVHLAAPALGTAPAREFDSNIKGLVNVLEAARQHGVDRVSLASSVAVYANAGPGPWRETMPLPVESASHTAAAKKALEIICLHFGDRTGMDVRVLRLAAIYGPLYHSMANLPSRLCHAAVRGEGPDLTHVMGGPPTADSVADLCYVKDCARGIQLVHLSEGLIDRIYNIGAGRPTQNRDLVAAVNKAVPDACMSLPDGPISRDGGAFMDISRIERDTGYKPEYDVESGITEYVRWLRTNPQ